MSMSTSSKSTSNYVWISTYEAALQAARMLSQHNPLILDCEGLDIAMPSGKLSIIAIGNVTASVIFLFDVLALSNKQHPSLAPLFQLLRSPDYTKLVWDGRADFFEIADTYGVLMGGVLDLQLVEVAQRPPCKPNNPDKSKKNTNPRTDHTVRFFKSIRDEVDRDPSILDGIHRLFGLGHCLGIFGETVGGKDPAVVARHRQNDSSMWLIRPLPADLIAYSGHDIELIARMYKRFTNKKKYLKSLTELKEMSVRYMHVYPSREMRAQHLPLDLRRFLPMDVLDAPQGKRYRCARCTRMLSLPCFSTRNAQGTSDTTVSERLTLCRLCNLLARNSSEGSFGDWVALTTPHV